MALDTFSNLKSSLVAHSHRNDVSDLLLTDFIKLAESEINRLLFCKELELTISTPNLSGRTYAIPTGLRKIRSFSLNIGGRSTELKFKTPEALNIDSGTNIPSSYTISDNIYFNITPASTYAISMTYYGSIVPLSVAAPTNSILTTYPKLYLYGALHHLYLWANNEEQATFYLTVFTNEIDSINRADKKRRMGPAPTMSSEKRYLP